MDRFVATNYIDQPIDEVNRKKLGFRAINLGLFANILLAAVKTSIGILGNSSALLADGINSISDVAYYLVVSVFMRLAGKPADDEHPYGHNQLESIASLVVGAFVITTAITIFWESVNNVYIIWIGEGDGQTASIITLYVALATIFIKVGLMLYTRKIGEETKNPVVSALAYDHRNDIFTAMAAVVGISLDLAGFPWVDPLASALVALVILRTGIKILRESAGDLMDSVPGKALSKQIKSLVNPLTGVDEVEEIHAHRFGPYLVINLTVGINGALSVYQGDRIATQVETLIMDQVPNVRRVHVHYHPNGAGKPIS
jgi:cation diffusion facilitator family transporter